MNNRSALSFRRRTAANTPGIVRKTIRMGEHYLRRQRDWSRLLLHARPARSRDVLPFYGSALLAPVTALRWLDGYQPPILLADMELSLRDVGVFHLRAGTDDPIHVMRWREPHVARELEARLRPGDTFVDAGANIGFYSVMAARIVGPRGRVVAIEMMPDTARQLRRNIEANSGANVTVHERALTSHAGQTIHAVSDGRKLGQARLAGTTGEGAVQVRSAKLDDILGEIDGIRLIKMDIEGAECDALRGGSHVLPNVEAIVFENNLKDPNVVEVLRSHSFGVRHLSGSDYVAERAT